MQKKERREKAVCLISSGIDSPVAAYLMMKSYNIIFAHFLNYRDSETSKKVEKIIKALGKISGKRHKLYLIEHYKTQEKIKSNCNTRYQCILCKRAMYRAAEKIAEKENAKHIITGESLAQVASQTLENMYVLDKAIKLVVLRPLIAFSKNETINIAKKIGTYDISIEKEKPCPYLPKNPATKSKTGIIESQEQRLGKFSLLIREVKEI